MSDDLGRGVIGWPVDRWQALDTLAGDTTTEHVILRNLVEHRDDPDAYSVRIAGGNIDVETVASREFNFDMENEDDEDLNRKVRFASQELAYKEDKKVLGVMRPKAVDLPISVDAFSQAKKVLGDNHVQHGFGAVVSTGALTTLEIEVRGVKSGLEIVESMLSTKVAQSNGLPEDDFNRAVGIRPSKVAPAAKKP